MSESEALSSSPAPFSMPTRRARAVTQAALVTDGPYGPDAPLPHVIAPATDHVDLMQWAAANRDQIDALLCQHGALLCRGFSVPDAARFRQVVEAACGGLLKYTYRASPRAEVSDRVYTSTEYPADQSIFPHNEHAFSPVFPRKLFFYCEAPASTGGETPIGSGRAIQEAIPEAVRRRFLERGVMYVRNYGDHLGLPWQTVFQATEPEAVEQYCRAHDIEWRWKPDGGLTTRQVAPAFIRHPVTQELIWFNHATFFHVTTLAPSVRDALLESYDEGDLPNNTYYGDGCAIEPEVLDELRAAYERHLVTFPWQQGDLLMVDNLLAVHARRPFTGPRRILVAMAEPIEAAAVRAEQPPRA